MVYLLLFLSGVLLCNGIPHLVSGMMGQPFPSPFAKPPGRGLSSPTVNFFWGTGNMVVGAYLFTYPAEIGFNDNFLAFLTGFLLMGFMMSKHFGKVRAGG